MTFREHDRSSVRRRGRLRDVLVGGGHLAVLSSFAVAQPLFDLLSRYAEFFAVRGSTRWDIVVLALVLTLGPPVALLALELLAWLVDGRFQHILHLVLVAGLAGVLLIQVLKRSLGLGSTAALIGCAAVVGGLVALAYRRVRPLRAILTVLIPAPAIFLALFLFTSPVSKLVLTARAEAKVARVSAQAPVVVVVFDELPVTSIMGPDGAIDAVRFPNFARLASRATWFRNTSTISSQTTRAVPAIVTGRLPRRGQLPIASDHPQNLFTLLGGEYALDVSESQTRICPPELCRDVEAPRAARRARSLYSDVGIVYLHLLAPPEYEARLPAITNQWMNFGTAEEEVAERALVQQAARTVVGRPEVKERFYEGRVRQLKQFVRSIERRRGRPTLSFLHVLLPHGPWQYFPSGSQSALLNPTAPGRQGDTWTDRSLALQAYQRHLLQARFTDALLGRIVRRLQRLRLYDGSLVVVTADHGVSFRAGDERRHPSATNLQDLAFVPLLVKRPGQRQGQVLDRHVRTIDILPTIADALGIRIPWAVDGRSAFRGGRAAGTITISDRSAAFQRLLAARTAALARQVRLFGSGADRPGIFGIGPHPELIGRSLADLRRRAAAGTTVSLDELEQKLLRALPEGTAFVPSPLQGSLAGAGATPGRALAVAVNGTVAAVCTAFSDSGATRFSALVPEEAFRAGRNDVELFWIEPGAGGLELVEIAGA